MVALILVLAFCLLAPVSVSAQQVLVLGTPVAGSLSGAGDEQYYEVQVSAGQHLFVVLDAEDNSNHYDLYIKFGSLPTTTDYDDKGDFPYSDQAVEVGNTQAGTYYVLVRSSYGGGNYTIVAYDDATFPSLTLGTPTVGSLQASYDIKYYRVPVEAGEHLFVVLDGEDNSDHYYLYIKFGSLPTTVDYDDCGDSSYADQAVEIDNTQSGSYYVLLRSANNFAGGGGGDYSIVAHDGDTFPELEVGVSRAGSLQNSYDIKYYQVSVEAGEHLFVVLDAEDNADRYDLYIKFGSLPTMVDYDDQGKFDYSDQAVEISETQAGVYYVMIRSNAGGGDYIVVAHDDETFPSLSVGISRPGSLQASYDIKYYQLSVSAGEHIFVVLDAEDNFDYYDLYVKYGSLPTTIDYDDRGDLDRADQAVEIACTQVGTYYVMLRSAAGGGNYIVTAHDEGTFPTLSVGLAEARSLQSSYDVRFYRVSVSAGKHFFVFLDAENNSNHYDLYVKYGSLPTTMDYDDKGSLPYADQAVEIASTQAGVYYVMVRSTSGGGNYTVVAHYDSTLPTLGLGTLWTSLTGSLSGYYDVKFYRVPVADGGHLFVIMDAEDNSDRYDLYIKFGSLPTTIDYDDRGDLDYSDQAVEVADAQSGVYYVMVRSTSGGGDYVIAAYDDVNFPTLKPWTPKEGSLQGSYDVKYYRVSVVSGGTLSVILKGDGGGYYSRYDLFIKYAALPTTIYYDDKGDASGTDQEVRIPSTRTGDYYVMVRSVSGGGDYTIQAEVIRCRIALPIVLRGG